MDAEQYAAIMTGIEAVKVEQAAQRRELLGNGQPGRIQLIEASVEKHEEKIEAVEKKIWYFTGGLVVASHLLKGALAKIFGGHWS